MRREKGIFAFFALLAIFTVSFLSGCSGESYVSTALEKEPLITEGEHASISTTSSTIISSFSQVQGSSSVSMTVTSCVNGECAIYHLEKNEAF